MTINDLCFSEKCFVCTNLLLKINMLVKLECITCYCQNLALSFNDSFGNMKIIYCFEITSKNIYLSQVEDDCGDLAVWLWLLGSVSQANSVQLHVSIRSSNPNDKELHFVSPAFSLATSWQEVLKSPRGVISITDDVISKNFTQRKDLNLHIEVVELLGGQTPVQL